MVLRFVMGPWDGAELVPPKKPGPFIEPAGDPFSRPRRYRTWHEPPGRDHYELGSPACVRDLESGSRLVWEYRWRSSGGPRKSQSRPAAPKAVR
jgi:hypothetical protein